MVRIHIKRGNQSEFLYDTQLNHLIENLSQEITTIFNGRLKINRICNEINELIKYGPMYSPEILGLTDEQVTELKLIDEWEEKCIPQDGYQFNKDPIGRRNGRQPNEKMQQILKNAIDESTKLITNKLVLENKCLTIKDINLAMDILRGSVIIVYPMQLPPHDVIRMEFSNTEDLNGTQASLEIIEPSKAQLWFAGKQMLPNKKLTDYLGKNDKCKVIVKLTKLNDGPPAREPIVDEEARKKIMLYEYRRQEELKKLDSNDDDEYLNSNWSDSGQMKRQMHGLCNVKFRGGFS